MIYIVIQKLLTPGIVGLELYYCSETKPGLRLNSLTRITTPGTENIYVNKSIS